MDPKQRARQKVGHSKGQVTVKQAGMRQDSISKHEAVLNQALIKTGR